MPSPVSVYDPKLYGAVLREGFAIQRDTIQRRAEPVSGPARFRRILAEAILYAQFEIVQTEAQFQAFDQWFATDIREGLDWFSIDLHIGVRPRTVVAHFVTGPRYQIIGAGFIHARRAVALECFEAVGTAYDHPDPVFIDAGSPGAPAPAGDLIDAGTPGTPAPAADRIWGGDVLGREEPN